MTHRRVLHRSGFAALIVLVSAACGTASVSEEDQLEAVREAETTAGRIEAARAFLESFPDSDHRRPVVTDFFQAALEEGNAVAAVEAAEAYIATTAEDRRDSLANYLAWSLAERGLALDFAEDRPRNSSDSTPAGSRGIFLKPAAWCWSSCSRVPSAIPARLRTWLWTRLPNTFRST
jgi:hypothetical protein